MSTPGEWFRRARYLLNRGREEEALRREMEAHRELMAAPVRFGNTLRLREESQDVWGWRWLDDLLQDVRYAIRTLLFSHRTFAVTAVATLAIGIGATTAVFTVVSALLLRPLPFADPERLVQLRGTTRRAAQGEGLTNLDVYRRESTSLEAVAGYEVGARYLRHAGGVERIMVVRTELDFFSILGVPPLAGQAYRAADPAASVVLSESFWRRRLGAATDAVGRTLILDERPFTIVAIMPEWFQFPYQAGSLLKEAGGHTRSDLWMPFDGPLRPRGRIANVVGRLKPGVSHAAAQRELDLIAQRLAAEDAVRNAGRGVAAVPLAREVVTQPMRRLLLVLFGAVGIVLALACANVANLSLARMTLRQREVSVRAALGASPSRLGRQFLTESLLLALSGGLAGVLLAWWILKRLIATASPYLPRAHEVGLDWRVFAFMLAVCMVVGTALGVAPAILAARRDPRATLQEGGHQSTMSLAQRQLRNGLVVVEVALAFVLATGAAVLLRELARMHATDPGLQPQNVLTLHVGHRRDAPGGAMAFHEIADRVAGLPGVRAAGFSQMLPLQSWGWTSNSVDFRVRGRAPRPEEFSIELRYVTPGYFDALGIPITRGRGFTRADMPDSLPVIIINEALARRAFPGEDPVGLVTTRGTIVGTIADVRQEHLDRPAVPEVYYPAAQNWSALSELGMTLVVRTQDRPELLVEAVRSAIRDAAPDRAIFSVKTMDRVVADSLAEFRLTLSILAGFALLGLTLALSGTYGVISYLASSRTREFAIRVALGAGRAGMIGLVLVQGLVLTALGLAIGAGGSLLASPLFAAGSISVRPPDAAVLVPVAGLIAIVAAAAALIPARRASRVDPMHVLRAE
jgi:predicted permease